MNDSALDYDPNYTSEELVAPSTRNLPVRLTTGDVDPTKRHIAVWGGLDLKTPAGAALYASIRQTDDSDNTNFINQTLPVVNVVCEPRSRLDENTGELQSWVATVLVLASGALVGFGSRGVWESVGLIAGIYGLPPWKEPVTVIPRVKQLGSGRQWKWLELVVPDQPKPAGKPKK